VDSGEPALTSGHNAASEIFNVLMTRIKFESDKLRAKSQELKAP
jgi:hypothetical protein